MGEDDEKKGDGDALNNNEIMVCNAMFCQYNGILMSEGCYGCMSSLTFCCFEAEFCCKSGAPSLVPCYCMGCRPVCEIVIKSQGQFCCCASAMAIPCDAEVPCMFGCLGLICYPRFKGCCAKLGTIMEADGYKDNVEPEQVG